MTRDRVGRTLPRVRLAPRWVRYRFRALLVIAAVASLLGLSVVGIATVYGSLRMAAEEGVRADLGQRSFTVQAGTEDARAAVARVSSLLPVSDAHGYVESGSARTEASIRAVGSPRLELGVLVDGRRPTKSNEATVSRALSDDAGVAVGHEIDVLPSDAGSTRVKVVGITVDPADARDATVVTFDPDLKSKDASLWLSTRDPYSVPELQSLMDARSITYNSVSSIIATSRSSLPVSGKVMKSVEWGVGVLLALLCLSVMGILAPLARRDVGQLAEAGMTRRRAWRMISSLSAGAAGAGLALGFLIATAACWAWRKPISNTFGQDWQEVSVAIVPILILLTLTFVLAVALRVIARGAYGGVRKWPQPWGRWRLSRFGSLIAVAAGLVTLVTGVLASRLQSPPNVAAALPTIGATAILIGLPGVTGPVFVKGLPPATKAVARRLASSVQTAAVVAGVIAMWAGVVVASGTHNANAFEAVSGRLQPAGSLLLTEVPDQAAQTLIARYRQLGGKEVAQYDLPDEQTARLRVTGTRLLECMQRAGTLDPDQVDEGCFPQKTLSPVAIIALSRPGVPEASIADSGLVREGQVGLLLYTSFTPKAESLATTHARGDVNLGGNMPGLVVSPTGAVAQHFNLRPSGRELLAILDFSNLTSKQRARFRSAVSRVAPAAQIAEASDVGSYADERARAGGIGVAGAVIGALTLVGGGIGALLSHRRTRRMLAELGGSSRKRVGLAGRWIAGPAVVMVLAAVLAWIGANATGTNLSGSSGWIWLAPFGAGLACCVILFLAMIHVPSNRDD